MNGAEAIVKAWVDSGVDTVFGLPGLQLDPLFNALFDAQQKIRVINARHEQGVAYMALGAAQATGRPAVYACVPGPGFLNTAAALSTAYAVHAPVMALVGQIRSDRIGLGGGELHELPDQSSIVRGLTRWSRLASSPNDIPEILRQAFESLAAGVGPVAVEAPLDVLGGVLGGLLTSPPTDRVAAEPELIDPTLIEAAAALLSRARSPLIFVGGGALESGASLVRIAERLQAPVVSHLQGRGVLASDDPLSLGLSEAAQLWSAADVVLAVGTRLHGPLTDWRRRPGQTLIRIDIDPKRLQGEPGDVAIKADVRLALPALAEAVERSGAVRASRRGELTGLKREAAAECDRRLPVQMAYLGAIRRALPDDAVVVADYTQIGYVAAQLLPVRRPRRILTPGYQGTLGFAYATALGAKAALPDQPVVSLSGDGGFLFTANELATAVQHGLPVIAVVFNDGGYGNVRRMQQDLYGGRVIASDLRNPDFLAFARSFGVAARRADTPQSLEEALAWALDQREPTLIEVPLPKLPSPWDLLEPMAP